ncbi:hypothetical protein [Chryseobacterium indoltheticum]|uniref:Uncharacterized protein n=1 Tax=Chryseobacterium indoltheticum TaxID=254 RepID=A0A381FA92_9FLAO|nr:hypothetical protein [Chryseobacterium indoltheticum]SIR25087.1 hypothetical protein SAMN05421682_115122 [Chryseobacterium indoltheticum]SUX43455.1 Uncharacterised protein [Chryseobacterium indoltheticum]
MINSTIKPKRGQCLDCPPGTENYLTAKRCEHHYKIHRALVNAEKNKDKLQKPKKAIPKVSAKRKIENPQYTIKRLQFLAQPENLRCFIEGCNKRADTVEHTMGRKGFADQWARDNNISLYLDVRFWKPCCNDHNLELERNPELSQKYQLSKISGNAKIQKENQHR